MLAFLGAWKIYLSVIVFGVIVFGVWRFEANIKDAAYQEFYAKDVQQALDEKQKEIDRLGQIDRINQSTIADLTSAVDKVSSDNAALLAGLKGKKDGPLAPVLRDTLMSLGGKR